MPHNVHLICGLPGAGKSTYAEQLRLDLTGVRFSIGDWNDRLFFMDRDPTSDFHWFYERVQRSCAQMRDTVEQVIAAARSAIFDRGLTIARQRRIFNDRADDHGLSTALHYLDIAEKTRWQHVQSISTEHGETHRLEITRNMFDFMNTIWEAPTPMEMALRNGQHITN